MTTQQFLAFTVIGLMMAAFVWGRFRYDIVAMCSLLAAVVLGIVPIETAFSGFSDEIVIIVGSAFVVSAGVARSGLMEAAVQRFVPQLSSVRAQLAVLVIIVTVLSAFVKNIATLPTARGLPASGTRSKLACCEIHKSAKLSAERVK